MLWDFYGFLMYGPPRKKNTLFLPRENFLGLSLLAPTSVTEQVEINLGKVV